MIKPLIYPIYEMLYQVKQVCQRELGWVAVRGEISNCKRARSGHLYFRLKDKGGTLDAVMFRAPFEALHFVPEDGLEVVAWGECSLFAPQGRLQLVVELMERVGRGTLAYAFEQLKKRLQEEGCFDPETKKPLPAFPRRIALITSATGAALQDLLHVLTRRSPSCSLLLASCQVQGSGAAEKIADTLARVNQLPDIDLIILGRGGGPIEDLWAFNEEVVARAIVASEIPVLSGVGHETDTTIADWVADARAPTPSAAAEIAVPEEARLRERLDQSRERLGLAIQQLLARKALEFSALSRSLRSPQQKIQQQKQALSSREQQLQSAMYAQLRASRQQLLQLEERLLARDPRGQIEAWRDRLDQSRQQLSRQIQRRHQGATHRLHTAAARLEALSPLRVLQRGYGLVYDARGALVRDPRDVAPGAALTLQLAQGELAVRAVTKGEGADT